MQAPSKGGIATPNAPSIGVPLRFVLTGMTALITGVLWLVMRPDILATYHYNQYVVAITHWFTLGFICSIVMGAMYQLVPVALETRLYSEKLAKWQFIFHLVGFVGMVWKFWIWDMKAVGHYGSVMAVGAMLFVYNVARTLWRVPKWNVVAGGVASALAWFALTILAGLYVVAAKCWEFSPFDPVAQMHAHAHLGGIGFFLMIIVSVSYKLLPMFALSDLQNERRAWWSVGLLNGGLAGLFFTILLRSPWKLGFALVVIAGLAVYAWEIIAILRARKRRMLDWGLRYFLTALGVLAPLSALAVILCWPGLPATVLTTQLENVYGFLGLIGVVALTITGFLYKIVPFLVWYHAYGPEVGRSKVPSLGDLYSARLQAAGYWLFLTGLAAMSISAALGHETAVRRSTLVLSASLLVFAVNMGRILSHFIHPKTEPLIFRKVAGAKT